MLYTPSHFWSCHFPAMACALTIVLYALFGVPAILLILPAFFFYSIFLYGTFKRSAISIIVENDKVFIRQGVGSEKEYAIEDITIFIISRKSFSNMKALSILEWFFFKPKYPTQMTMVTVGGRESLLFSYLYGSPLKKSWVKFKKQLEQLTNKPVNLEIQNMKKLDEIHSEYDYFGFENLEPTFSGRVSGRKDNGVKSSVLNIVKS